MNTTLSLRIATVVLAISLVAFWSATLRPVFLGGPASFITISGQSMVPTFRTGDLVVLRQRPEYRIGDVVAFRVENGENVIHRIVGGDGASGYLMRGDNKNANDPWMPRDDQILGEEWFHIDSVGSWYYRARSPVPFGVLAGTVGMVAFAGQQHRRRRKRGGGWKAMNKRDGIGDQGLPVWALSFLVGLGLLLVGAAAIAFQSWRTPTERRSTETLLEHTNSASFSYEASVTPSVLYPEGIVGPVVAAPGSTTTTNQPPIYLASSPELRVDFGYAFLAPSAVLSEFSGEVASALVIRVADRGWTKTISLGDPISFSGQSVSVPLVVKIPEIDALIGQIERETGFKPSAYDLVVSASVHVSGTADGQQIDEWFAPQYAFRLEKSQITGSPEMGVSEHQSVTRPTTASTSVGTPVGRISTPHARIVSSGVLAAAMAGLGVFAAYSLMGVGRNESAKIRARYGAMLVSVRDTRLDGDPQRQIRLQNITDLVKLAKKDSRMILHQVAPDGTHVYFIQDADVTYLYVGETVPARSSQALSEA